MSNISLWIYWSFLLLLLRTVYSICPFINWFIWSFVIFELFVYSG
jgi:hypothetical protein